MRRPPKFFLPPSGPGYSVTFMHVEISEEASPSRSVRDEDHYNLSIDAGAMEKIAPARIHAPLRNLLTHLNAKDSLFSTFASKVWNTSDGDGNEASVFGSRVDVIFLREDANFGIGPHEELAKRLSELLAREPGSALRVGLQVLGAQFGGNQGFCLRISLEARGATPEQAQLRWGLGLARVQQALLFVARGLRHEPGVAD